MGFGVKVEVWGAHALLARPEFSVERMTYDVITPSAARGILESVYWHPGLRYIIDRIHVLNEIKRTSIRRNEVSSKAQASAMRSALINGNELPYINTKADIAQRASVVLVDVRYVIEAHFEMTGVAGSGDNPGKFCDILRRRLRKGQCYSQPYLGTREFACHYKLLENEEIPSGFYAHDGERDLGFMLFDMDYSNPNDITPMFFRAVMKDGVIDVAGSEVYR